MVSSTAMLSSLKKHGCAAEALRLYAQIRDKGRAGELNERSWLVLIAAHRLLRGEARASGVCAPRDGIRRRGAQAAEQRARDDGAWWRIWAKKAATPSPSCALWRGSGARARFGAQRDREQLQRVHADIEATPYVSDRKLLCALMAQYVQCGELHAGKRLMRN